jgi:hypothetical protein
MSPSVTEIERLVQEVMHRLGGNAHLSQRQTTNRQSGTFVSNSAEQNTPRHSLVLRQRVICLSDVEGKVDGGGTVAMPSGAVITPSARDYLRGRNARLECVSVGARTATGNRTVSFALASRGISAEPMVRTIEKLGMSVQRVPNSGLAGVVSELCDAVALGGNLGLLITEEWAAALCLANRRRGVRAATAQCVAEVEEASTAIAMNLLVLRSVGLSTWQLQRIVQKFCHLAIASARPRYPQVLE